MNFKEAMEALKGGARVTRKPWTGSMFFKIDDGVVHSYQPMLHHYQYNEDIMISTGWEVEGEEGMFDFYDIIPFLQQGKKARLSDWKEMYIQYDSSEKCIVLYSMDVFPYHPDFEAFTAQDWVVVE